MSLYRIFIITFILNVAAFVLFLVFYFNNVYHFFYLMEDMQDTGTQPNPYIIMHTIFNPPIIIAAIILGLSGLTTKILGIVFIARNPNIDSTEKVIWILGFILFNFITAIVFMALKNSNNLLATKKYEASQFHS